MGMMQQCILDKVEESFKKAEAFYGKTFSRPRNIIFKRNGTTGGWCCYGRKEFMFQLDFAEAYPVDFIEQTVPHEVAHWIDSEVYGSKFVNGRHQSHGPRWKYIMRFVYGLNPDRCHTYDTSVTITRKQTRHEYSCACGNIHKVSTTNHNKIQRGQNRVCRTCRQRIVLTGNIIAPVNKLTSLQAEIEKLKQQLQNL